jgi:hypothetical protein
MPVTPLDFRKNMSIMAITIIRGATMTTRIALGSLVILLVFAIPAHAGGKSDLQKYLSDASRTVLATENASDKRIVLDQSLQTVSKALEIAQHFSVLSKDDGIAIARFMATIKDRQDELAGNNGFQKVADDQLNAFSYYVVQDVEQADQVITISVVTLLLIIILIVLLVK